MNITRTTDFELLARLNKPLQDLHASLYPDIFTEYNFEAVRDSFKTWVTKENFTFLLVEDSDEPIGYAWIEMRDYPQSAFTKQRKSVFIHHIGIAQSHSRKGYGSHLMNYIFELARNEGIETVELDYWVDNQHAEHFYNKQGFLAYRKFAYKKSF